MFRYIAMVAIWFSVPVFAGAASPAVQVVPLPEQEIAFEIDGREIARYHGGNGTPKPFLFPLIGPAGRHLTSMSHPIDPHGHRHHRSVWIGHRDVNGHNFWEENDGNRIVMTRLEGHAQDVNAAWFRAAHEWRDATGVVVLNELRTLSVTRLDGGAYYLDIAMAFSLAAGEVTFGQTPYGLLGVRVVPFMSVSGGAGRILNTDGALNESGVHGKAARWVDYSGPVAPDAVNGVAYFDHPGNPDYPATYLVRDEGWMCASFTAGGPVTVKAGETLEVNYRLYIHGADDIRESLEEHAKRYAGR